jgi:hypothetical protein
LRKSLGHHRVKAGAQIHVIPRLMKRSSIETTRSLYIRVSDANERVAAKASERLASESAGTAVTDVLDQAAGDAGKCGGPATGLDRVESSAWNVLPHKRLREVRRLAGD